MILVSEADGRLVKSFSSLNEGVYGYHPLFGFISEFACIDRLKARKRKGLLDSGADWSCRFKINKNADGWKFGALDNCQISTVEQNKWRIQTSFGKFLLLDQGEAEVAPLIENIGQSPDDDSLRPGIFASIIFFIILASLLWFSKSPEKPLEEKLDEIVVELVEHKAVQVIQTQKVNPTVQEVQKKNVTHRAVQQNLGFLGLVGQKNLTKAVGGAPMELAKASAGAGQGGDAGSGGELLVGLGKGVKRTTVGNSGVAGLGGIGTKGKGGGQGGYGDTLIASGEGKGLSTIGVSQDALLEGGLSKYVIMATINRYIGQIRACYEQELKINSGISGIVTVDFEISGAGTLNFAKVTSSTLANKNVENCMIGKMMTWQFPKPRGGVNVPVKRPFELRPQAI